MIALRAWVMAALLAGCSTLPAAAACPYMMTPVYMPPAKYQGLPLPGGVRIVHMPLAKIRAAGDAAGLGNNIFAAADVDGGVMILPNKSDVPAACYALYVTHETAHFHGWRHP